MRLSIDKLKNAGVTVIVDEDSIYFAVENESLKVHRLVKTLIQEMALSDVASDEFISVVHRFGILQAIKAAS